MNVELKSSPIERLSGVRMVAAYALLFGTLGIAVGYASAFAGAAVAAKGAWVMAVALPVAMIATMTLGAVRTGRRLGSLVVPFLLVFVLIAGGFVLALALPPDTADGVYWLGLPRRAAVILYGVGLLPLFVLPLAYAFTFDALTLSDADIDRVRAARRASLNDGAARTGGGHS